MLAITPTPSIINFLLGDVPISLTLGTSGSLHPNWATSDGGTFSDRHSETPTFTSKNQTQMVTINGRRVSWGGDGAGFGWGNVDSASVTGSGAFGNVTKYAGTSSWATPSRAIGNSSDNATETFYEFVTAETNKEKAGGLCTNGSNGDPTNTSAPFIDFCWHLKTTGMAVARHSGNTVGDEVPYTATDVFKVYKNGLTVYYLINNKVIRSVTIANQTWNLYPIATFKDVGGTLNSNVFFSDTSQAKQGILTFQLYGVFPEQPNYTYELAPDNKTLSSFAEDGTAVFRKKGELKKVLSLQFISRPYTEYLTINDFWEWHQKHLKFYYRDSIFEKIYRVVHDSGLRIQVIGPDQITINMGLKEV